MSSTDLPRLFQQRPPEGPVFAAVDVGGTNIKLGLVDDEGRSLAYESVPTAVDDSGEVAIQRVGQAIRQLIQRSGIAPQQVVRLGLATPGPLDAESGMLLEPGNLPNWWNFPIAKRMSDHSGLDVTYVNDANAAAYGEFWCGAGQAFHSMVLLTLGTGIGGGIIIGDLLVEGEHSCGSECGHIVIDLRNDAPRDSLGKAGSLEAFCGAYAVIRRAEQSLAAGRQSSLAACQSDGDEITPLLIAQHAEAGDELSREIVFETARYLAIGIVSFVHTIDPNGIVLGGAMTFGGAGHPLGEAFIERVRAEAQSRMLQPLRDKIAIEFATLAGDAGFIGAAGLARRDYRNLAADIR